MSKIYEELIQLNNHNKLKIQFKTGAEDLNRPFSKDDRQMANTYMKIYSTSLVEEMHMKTTMRNDLAPVRMATINKTINNKCW